MKYSLISQVLFLFSSLSCSPLSQGRLLKSGSKKYFTDETLNTFSPDENLISTKLGEGGGGTSPEPAIDDKKGCHSKGSFIPYNTLEIRKKEAIQHSVAHFGHEHILVCPIKACPQAQVTWYKDDGREGPIQAREYRMYPAQSQIILSDDTLKITMNRREDDGKYTCVAQNMAGTLNYTIDVSSQVRHGNDKPRLKEQLTNHTVLVGSNLTMRCEPDSVDASNPITITWYRVNNVNGSSEDTKTRNATQLETILDTDLVLYNLQVSDSAFYGCQLSNFFDKTKSVAFINVVESLEEEHHSNLGMILSLVATFSGLVIVACFFVIVWCYKKSRKSERDKLLAIENAKKVAYWTKKVLVNREQGGDENLNPRITIQKVRREFLGIGDSQPHSEYEFMEDPKWEFPRNLLNIGELLGEGAFGRVKLATAKAAIVNGVFVLDPKNKEVESEVAVKMLKEGHTDTDVTDLYSELEIMKRIGCHMNIINLLGECSQPPGSTLLVIVEYARYGNLRQFLRDRKPGTRGHLMERRSAQVEREAVINNDYLQLQNSGGTVSADLPEDKRPVSLKMMLSFALQVSRGMEFLSSRRCVHRDLAARNVLVSENLVLKIADFGMARDLQDSEYYRKESDGRLPIKWMAPESLFSRISTTMSDVWSFGILFWEIVTFGDTPYKKELSPKVFMELIKSGYKMQQPIGCPDSVYSVMCKCWEYQPDDRPGWGELVASLYELHNSTDPDKYLDLNLPGVDTPPSSPETSWKDGKSPGYVNTCYSQNGGGIRVSQFAANHTYDHNDQDSTRPLLSRSRQTMENSNSRFSVPLDATQYIQVYTSGMSSSDQNYAISDMETSATRLDIDPDEDGENIEMSQDYLQTNDVILNRGEAGRRVEVTLPLSPALTPRLSTSPSRTPSATSSRTPSAPRESSPAPPEPRSAPPLLSSPSVHETFFTRVRKHPDDHCYISSEDFRNRQSFQSFKGYQQQQHQLEAVLHEPAQSRAHEAQFHHHQYLQFHPQQDVVHQGGYYICPPPTIPPKFQCTQIPSPKKIHSGNTNQFTFREKPTAQDLSIDDPSVETISPTEILHNEVRPCILEKHISSESGYDTKRESSELEFDSGPKLDARLRSKPRHESVTSDFSEDFIEE